MASRELGSHWMLEYEERLLSFVGPSDTIFVGTRCEDLGAHMGAIHVHVFRFRADSDLIHSLMGAIHAHGPEAPF